MVLDHIHEFFPAYNIPVWFNILGRLVFPIFLFMLAEGFYYTHNRARYLLQLFIGFLLMNFLDMAISLALPIENLPIEKTPVLMNNIFGTLFLTGLYIFFIDQVRNGFKNRKIRQILVGFILFFAPILVGAAITVLTGSANSYVWIILTSYIPNVFATEGGWLFILLGIVFYILRAWRWAQMLTLVMFSFLSFALAFSSSYNIQWLMVLATIPLSLYNGKRGGSGKKLDKYFFYAFYPVHIYLLYFLAYLLQR